MLRSEAHSLSFLAVALFEIILSISLAFPPVRHRGTILSLLLFGLYCHIVQSTTGDPKTDWVLALSITPQLGKAFDLLLLVDAEKTLTKKCDSKVHPDRFPFWKKLCWSFEVVHTPRGVGWNWETPYICYSGCETRRDFIRSRLSRVIFYYLLLDLLQHTSSSATHILLTAGQRSNLTVLASVWSYAVALYLHLWMFHTIPALLVVISGLGNPRSYPYVMGPVGYMNSLRGLWGRTWHQAGRRVITSFGIWLREKVFRVPAGSYASTYIQLCTGFTFGGVTHALAGWMAGERMRWQDKTGAIAFFTMQLLGVMLEDAVFETMLRLGNLEQDWRRGHKDNSKEEYGVIEGQWRLGSWPRILGYIWVVGWLSITLPAYVESLSREGVLESTFVPFSVIDWTIAGAHDLKGAR